MKTNKKVLESADQKSAKNKKEEDQNQPQMTETFEPVQKSELYIDKSSPNFNVSQNLVNGPGNVKVKFLIKKRIIYLRFAICELIKFNLIKI